MHFLVTNFDTVESFNHLDILWCSIYNTCLNFFNISCLFSGGITNSSTILEFSSITGFGFTSLLTISFPIKSPVASAASWNTF